MQESALTWSVIRATPVIWLSVTVVVLGQLAITYVPWLQRVFKTEGVGLSDSILMLGIGITMFLIIEVEKQLRIRVLKKTF